MRRVLNLSLDNRSLKENMYSGTPLVWNPSCEATPIAPKMWPFKRGDLWSRVKINTYTSTFRFTLSSDFSRGVVSHQDGLSNGVPLSREC